MFSKLNLRASENAGVEGEIIEATFDRDDFAGALTSIAAALSDNETGWVQLDFKGKEYVQLSAVSHNISIRNEVIGQYTGTGVVKVNGRQLAEYVKQLPSEKLQITAQLPRQLTLKCGRSSARMQLVQDPSHAEISIPPYGTRILAKCEFIERWVNTFKDFVAVDDTRFYANGALIWAENEETTALYAVASDALRLAKARMNDGLRVESVDQGAVLVPKKALDELKRVCAQNPGGDVQLRWHQESQFFAVETESYIMMSKCIAGKYPPYTSALPKEVNFQVRVPTRALLESARRVLLFADKNRIIKLNFDGQVLDVQSFTPGQKEGEDVVDLPQAVESPFEVNYNGTLLTGILNALGGAEFTFSWENVNRPVQIQGELEKGVEVFYLLVPTRF